MDDFYRIKRLPPYVLATVTDLKVKARARGEDIIDLGMGNPDRPTPRHIVDKLVEAAKNPRNHRYSASRGIRRLRVAIARWYRERFGVELDPETEAIATIGSKEGLAHLMLALLQPGDAVLVPNPAYPIHAYSVVIADGDLRSVPLVAGEGHGEFFARLEEAVRLAWPKPKGLLLNFPHNPTTQVTDPAFFERVVDFATGASPLGHPRLHLRGPRLRRVPPAVLPGGPGREGGRRRVLLADEVVQHGRLAARLRLREPAHGPRPRPDQVLPRLRGLPAHPDRRHRGPGRARRPAWRRSPRPTAGAATS